MPEKSDIKVAMVISKAEASLGGTQKQAFRLAHELQSQGVSVSFLTKRKRRQHGNGQGAELNGKVQIIHLPVTDFQPAWSFLFSFVIWAWINRGSFQIIHAHNAAMGVISSIVGWIVGKKVVVKIPSLKYVEYLNGGSLSRELRRWIITRKTDRFIAVSREMLEALREAGIAPKKLALISNGIERAAPCSIDPGALRKELSAEGPVVLFVGRLVKEKGLDRLLRAWAALPGHEGMLLLIAGDGPLREDLESQTRALGLFPSVRFLGHQTDVTKLYSIAELFVLPSKTEGMSNSLLEAMAAGLPVVASNVGGNKDVIKDHESGFLVDWEDTKLCVGILLTVLSDTELRQRIGNAARRQVSAFAMDDVAERYRDLYQAVLKE
jgi:glycosyltransferase involved in cell wall biosynthesis